MFLLFLMLAVSAQGKVAVTPNNKGVASARDLETRNMLQNVLYGINSMVPSDASSGSYFWSAADTSQYEPPTLSHTESHSKAYSASTENHSRSSRGTSESHHHRPRPSRETSESHHHRPRPSRETSESHHHRPRPSRETSEPHRRPRPRESSESHHRPRPSRETSEPHRRPRPRESSESHHHRPRPSRETSEPHRRPRPRESSESHHRPRPSQETSESHHRPRPRESSESHHHRPRPSRETSESHSRPRPSRETSESHHMPRPSRESSESHSRPRPSRESSDSHSRPSQDTSEHPDSLSFSGSAGHNSRSSSHGYSRNDASYGSCQKCERKLQQCQTNAMSSETERTSCEVLLEVAREKNNMLVHDLKIAKECIEGVEGIPLVRFSSNKKLYYLSQGSQVTWSDADTRCKALGMRLVTMADAKTVEAFTSYIEQEISNGAQVWIGANDITKEGEFEWAPFEPVLNLALENENDHELDCVFVSGGLNHVTDCDTTQLEAFVCEVSNACLQHLAASAIYQVEEPEVQEVLFSWEIE